ncbi:MAG TPA: TasA family protein [Dehalococcoidales bacterium]|nr:TasA family protein [Dehalococcoidales bacterium]
MKKIIGLSILALLLIGIVSAGTWAYFSDTETSTGNTFTAGTLNLTVNGNDGTNTALFTVSAANPGQTGASTWTLHNAGSMSGYIDLENISVTNAENYDAATDEAERAFDSDTSNATGGGELGANMDVVIFIDDGAGGGIANNHILDGGEVTIYSGKLDSIAASYDQNLALAGGATTYITMTWSVGSDVNGTIMGDSATLNVTFELGQTSGQ